MGFKLNISSFQGQLTLFAILLLSVVKAFGQQEPLYTQYMFNGLVINPAYAGSSDALNMTASARKQWIGMDGAPVTQTFSAHSPLKNEKIGVGLNLFNDKIGVTHQYGLNLIYAYRIKLNKDRRLAFGLQAGITQFNSRYTALTSKTANDPSFSSDQISSFIPTFGGGIYYTASKFYLGFSIPHIVNNILRDSTVSSRFGERRHFFLTSGYVFTLSPDLKIKPSILVKSAQGSPVQIDLNTNLLIRDVLWLGVSYRSFTALNFLTQVQLTNQLRLGYSYDLNVNQLGSINKGSHELILNYCFSFSKSKVVTPRYF